MLIRHQIESSVKGNCERNDVEILDVASSFKKKKTRLCFDFAAGRVVTGPRTVRAGISPAAAQMGRYYSPAATVAAYGSLGAASMAAAAAVAAQHNAITAHAAQHNQVNIKSPANRLNKHKSQGLI
ncbi:hypothetical protein U1Q18_048192 [Sarracenia purpurea var. burkii]